MIVKVPQFPWYGDTELELDFPYSWDVIVPEMAGWNAPKLTDQQIRDAFYNPIGTPRVVELAHGKKEVVVIFDDLTRPTKVDELIPYILQELKEGGIKDENIRFIAAIGAHGAMKLTDFQRKLGNEIPGRFLVYNHNPYENCTYLGTTSRGTPVMINSEFMACDLKISIGSIVPHPLFGFGGGSKMVVPGMAHIDTITANHHNLSKISESSKGISDGRSTIDGNSMRLDSEEATRMAGLHFSINALMNSRRETVGLFVGDLVKAHREGVKMAERLYVSEVHSKADIVVANSYAKANEAALVVSLGSKMLKKSGGDLVIIGNIPEGQICHYLLRSFGKNMGGRLWRPRTKLPPRVNRMIVLGPYLDKAGLDWIGPVDQIIMMNSWTEIKHMLIKSYGTKIKVVVVRDGTLQYFPNDDSPRDVNLE